MMIELPPMCMRQSYQVIALTGCDFVRPTFALLAIAFLCLHTG